MTALKTLITLALVFALSVDASAAEDSPQEIRIMQASHLAGTCQSFRQMMLFQSIHMLPDGDSFIDRFFKAEAVVYGLTELEFLKKCNSVIAQYNGLKSALNSQVGTNK